jgi:hypothetical protein
MKFRKLGIAVTPIDPFVAPNIGTPAQPAAPTMAPTTNNNLPTSGFGTSAASHNHKVEPKMPKFVKYAPNK